MFGPNRFLFLNQEHDLRTSEDWNNPERDKLWLYNLHYFDDLNAVGAQDRKQWHSELIVRWISENPPPFGNGWEPYPLSLRIINWIKWVLRGNQPSQEMVRSIAIQTRYLQKRLEIHLLGNHFFTNLKALLFAGCFFQGSEAERWFHHGLKVIQKELKEQILGDGGHFERSPMYHAIILEDILDVVNLLCVYPEIKSNNIFGILRNFEKTAKRMLVWSNVMVHPDGEIVLFNDAAFGIASHLKKLKDYASSLGIKGRDLPLPDLMYLQDTGYVRVNQGPLICFFDIAPIGPDYLPGHAHADTLSFEMSVGNHRVFVDTGVSSYEETVDRLQQRQSVSHNTLTVDHKDSSEVWGSYRVARRAGVLTPSINQENGFIMVRAAHDGFYRLKDVGKHEREWRIRSDMIEMDDKIDGAGTHLVELGLHVHPEVELRQEESHKIRLSVPSGHRVLVRMDKRFQVSIEPCSYHPEFGVSHDTVRIVGSYEGDLPAQFQTQMEVIQ
ncbi:MAG: alginate lyase family protein [Thermodesulfobacteriota bacterium]|nr:alginate lyase family protein [Thermodesulfobacteriota bacterium]